MELCSAGQVLTFPSAFTVETGAAHWSVLLRARAVETQCYVVAAAQTGRHSSKRASWGHSMIVDPWGVVVAGCGEGEGVALARLDLSYLHSVRSRMPVQSHRRPDLYGSVSLAGGPPDLPGPDLEFGPVTVPAAAIFARSGRSVAFTNKKPVVAGHVLVAPVRAGAALLGHLSSAETTDLFLLARRVETFLQAQYGVTSTTLSLQNGPLAGQTIPHVHVHLLPRREGDFPENDEIYRELARHDKEAAGWRTEQEMAEEAAMLREAWATLVLEEG